jgi:endonuclease YncB( thermonuclease family)
MRSGVKSLLGAALVAVGLAVAPASADVGERARVQDDGTLRVNGKTVRLYGIHIPTSQRTCRSNIRPVRCAPRAVLQLDFMIRGFVYCDEVQRFRDRSIAAICRTGPDREDLAARLLDQGWAVALPGAPFEYIALERFAQSNKRGFWGFQADTIRRF